MSRRSLVRAATVPALLGVLVLASLTAAGGVVAAEPTFGTPTMTTSFEDGLTVTQPVTLSEEPARVEVLLRYADAAAPLVVQIELPALELSDIRNLTYRAGPADGHVPPNTPVEARWRITPAGGGEPVLGPSVRGVLSDDRFDWRTVEGSVVRVHWYEGGTALGKRALAIGEEAVRSSAALLGVTEEEAVDFFVYADQSAFYDALGPGTRENVGGQANAEIRTLFALIGPDEIDDPWVGIVVPHELVHLVFDTAVSNPYHFPPRWLNEGLATYLSQGYDPGDRRGVEAAAADGTLIPLTGLSGQFPTSADRFFQAYAQSVSAVDYFIRTHGQDALVDLVRSYADGRTDDEAFTAAIGVDVAGFDAAWQTDLGAVAPIRHGPAPAPDGPLPADWASGTDPGAASPGPAASPAGTAGTAPETSPAATDPASGGPGVVGVVGLLAVLGVGAAVVTVLVLRSRSGQPRSTTEP